MCRIEKSHLTDDVLSYLVEHQDAQDTLEGIVEWWLVERRIVEQTSTIKEVLDEMVADGLVRARRAHDARTLYSINREKIEEIAARLKSQPGRPAHD
jgi:DNA-binding PadR family transcriptional regulator